VHKFSKNLENTSNFRSRNGYKSKLDAEDSRTSDTPIKHLAATATWRPGFVQRRA